MRRWWLLIPLSALGAVALWAVVTQLRPGGFWTPSGVDRAPSSSAVRLPSDRAGSHVAAPQQAAALFTARRDGERIVLSGLVAGPDARSALLEDARRVVPNGSVADETKTSESPSPGLTEAAAFGIGQLARLPSGSVTIRGDKISVEGSAPNLETYTAAADAVHAAPGGFSLDIARLLPPAVRPYTWSATSSEAGIALSGHVPSDAARQAIAAVARATFPDKQLSEQVQPASGIPSDVDFEAAAGFALTQLAQLRNGTVGLVDGTLNFGGIVTDRDTLAALRTALGRLPQGLHAGSIAIALAKPSPYTFRAERQAGTLTLTGYYPDRESRAAIHQLIRQRFFTEQIIDKLRAADGAPPAYLSGVSFGLEHLARLASGEVAVSDTSLRLSGEALYEETAEQTSRAVAAMSPRGWSGKADVKLRPAEKANAQLSSPQP